MPFKSIIVQVPEGKNWGF